MSFEYLSNKYIGFSNERLALEKLLASTYDPSDKNDTQVYSLKLLIVMIEKIEDGLKIAIPYMTSGKFEEVELTMDWQSSYFIIDSAVAVIDQELESVKERLSFSLEQLNWEVK